MQMLENLVNGARDAFLKASDWVEKYPGTALAIALVAGLLLLIW